MVEVLPLAGAREEVQPTAVLEVGQPATILEEGAECRRERTAGHHQAGVAQ